jgi:O-antigen/teichoic acid export membrane protein
VVNIALNIVLIPRYSFDGAAWATLATEVIIVVLMVTEARRIPGLVPVGLAFLVRLVPAAIMAALVGWTLQQLGPWPVAAAASAAVYVAMVVSLKAAGRHGLRGLLDEDLSV